VTNVDVRTITAWTLVVTSTEGATTRRRVQTTDIYLTEITRGLPQSSEELLASLRPGESRVLPLESLSPESTVEVVAVVLDNETAVGDEKIILEIFARREKERLALRAVVDAFNEVLSTQHGTAALEALRERFTALQQQDGSVPCRAALDALQTYSRSTNADEIDQLLKAYGAFVAREYELAVKHSRRKVA
jgi:hypothetical protein